MSVTTDGAQATESVAPPATLGALTRAFLQVGCLSFGGPAAQIAMMHRLVVDERRWLEEAQYLRALNFCMLLPGPEAQQLATYVGWRLHGWLGGAIAGLLFVLPGALVMLALSIVYALYAEVPFVEGIFFGIKAAVLAIVVEALIRISKRALKSRAAYAIAAAAFVAIFFFKMPFPIVILAAGVVGAIVFARVGDGAPVVPPAVGAATLVPALGAAALWAAPILLVVATLGTSHVLFDIAAFFSKLAVVTFGGAYAVLAYMTEQAVAKDWLTAADMVTGFGLAETTPGPLILVTQFVGFLAAFNMPAPFTPVVAGIVGAAMATWVTFAPSFLWIFAGAPWLEVLQSNRRLAGALSAITAAVVGVILQLAVWFALTVLFGRVGEATFGPLRLYTIDVASLDIAALALAAIAGVLVFVLHAGLIVTIAAMAALGVAVSLMA